MNDQTLKLLEKALQVSPEDWETRAHVVGSYLAAGQGARAAEILRGAPETPATEEAQLLKARVELEVAPSDAIVTLEGVLARNKACAEAYLIFAHVYRKRGLRDEARRKYGAANLLDESLVDPALAAWIDGKEPAEAPADRPPPLPLSIEAPKAPRPAPTLIPAQEQTDEPTDGVPADLLADIEAEDDPGRITFRDIGGMEPVIERVRMNIIYPFKNPEVFRKFNKRPGGGILMYGPPGCGKTHLARATAGECGAKFVSVAITDILSKWLGESERHLHDIFEAARAHSPAVLFFDEIDAIGVNRADAGTTMSTVVNVLLTEMDGIRASNDGLMVLAATNSPWRVDNALRRPGRFDRVLFVPPPDAKAREAILDIHLRGMPVKSTDTAKLAARTDKFSGADLRAVVERASEKAIYEEMRTGRSTELTQALLLDAVKETRPSTTEWLDTAKSYATYANKSGLYDELVAYFEK